MDSHSPAATSAAHGYRLFAGGGVMRALMREHDWSDSPLGDPARWPRALQTVVDLMLDSKFPMFVAWGPELAFLYNDSYIEVLGAKHPTALGRRFHDIWFEIWDDVGPLADHAMQGEATYAENMPLLMLRRGHEEQTYFTFSYSPVHDEDGRVAGMFCACTETTAQVQADRRQAFHLKMADRLRSINDPGEIAAVAAELLGRELRALRVGYGEIDAAERMVRVVCDWTDGSAPRLGGQSTPLEEFGAGIVGALRSGGTLRVSDVAADPRSASHAAAYEAIGTRAMIVVPLIKDGRLTSILSIGAPAPRRWTDEEVALAEDVGERTWAALERARAEQALADRLAAESDRLRTLFEQAPGFMAVLRGPEHVFELANAAYIRLVGKREILGKPAREAIPEAEGQGFIEKLDQVYMTGQPFSAYDEPFLVQQTPGAAPVQRYLDFIYQPVMDPDGGVVGIFVEGYDVTDKRQANAALFESEARYRALVENISNVIWHTSRGGAIVEENVSWGAFTGQSREQYSEWGWVDAVHPDDRRATLEAWHRALATLAPYEASYRLRRRDGQYRDMVARGVPVLDQDGELREWIGNCADVTEARRAEEALRVADRRKDEFLAMLAHELRNPLAPISMAAQILKMPRLDEQRLRQTSDIIARQVDHMTSLVDDLLDVSRVTRGLVTLAREPVDLKSVVADAVEQSRGLIEARRHRLTVQQTAQEAHTEGDRIRLIQVVANLLNNAAKYTDEGGEIRLTVDTRDSEVVLKVRDNGIGIAPELLPHVFDLFTQAERSPDRSQGGLGLGLGLVKSLVELHGGRAIARSAGLGQGSEFSICLPRLFTAAVRGRPAELQAAPGTPETRLRLMVVDDNIDAAQTLAAYLDSAGHEVLVEYDAKSALENAKATAPRVLVLDIGLPNMDGYELARRLRALPQTRDAILIALTGYGQAQDYERSRSAGFDYHLIKPVDIDRLNALLAGVENAPAAAGRAGRG